MKPRFLVFTYNNYYPGGGLSDLVRHSFQTLEEVNNYLALNKMDNNEVFDLESEKEWEEFIPYEMQPIPEPVKRAAQPYVKPTNPFVPETEEWHTWNKCTEWENAFYDQILFGSGDSTDITGIEDKN